ncbi:MAG: type II secretion system protein [Candidatus Eremiobacterota bacterium]
MRCNKGLTLSELVVTIAIAGVLIISTAGFFAKGLVALKKNQALIPGYSLGEQQLEKMRRATYEIIKNDYGLNNTSNFSLVQNNINYHMEVITQVIYKPHLNALNISDGKSLIKVKLNITWEAIKEQGKRNITIGSYIYTEPNP